MIYYPPIVRTGLTQKRVACIYGFLRFFFLWVGSAVFSHMVLLRLLGAELAPD